MKIGIGLPASIPGVSGESILDWARQADSGPFSSVGIIDRVVYPNWDPLITLAAVAAVTQRVRLTTTLLIAPVRDAALLAKQAASIDVLSAGRLTLGLGVGRREDDYAAVGENFHRRGRRFDQQLAVMKRVWAGEDTADGAGPIGPEPVQTGGPEILIGAFAPAAIKRAGRWADGYLGGGGDPQAALALYNAVAEAWKEHGRPGSPRFVATNAFALGSSALERGAAQARHYNQFLGPDAADQAARRILTTPDAIRQVIQDFSQVGLDEMVFLPQVSDLDQVDRLAEIVG
ncbi:MAG: hypothetical protein BZY88_10700 [SAR202 cluster bacterium Io17-Chloro-G9]|nr:MAG: hypothetical protein BZY88_10700 [SAR202 cluster bacterium Io17-Chloro-G9]